MTDNCYLTNLYCCGWITYFLVSVDLLHDLYNAQTKDWNTELFKANHSICTVPRPSQYWELGWDENHLNNPPDCSNHGWSKWSGGRVRSVCPKLTSDNPELISMFERLLRNGLKDESLLFSSFEDGNKRKEEGTSCCRCFGANQPIYNHFWAINCSS